MLSGELQLQLFILIQHHRSAMTNRITCHERETLFNLASVLTSIYLIHAHAVKNVNMHVKEWWEKKLSMNPALEVLHCMIPWSTSKVTAELLLPAVATE